MWWRTTFFVAPASPVIPAEAGIRKARPRTPGSPAGSGGRSTSCAEGGIKFSSEAEAAEPPPSYTPRRPPDRRPWLPPEDRPPRRTGTSTNSWDGIDPTALAGAEFFPAEAISPPGPSLPSSRHPRNPHVGSQLASGRPSQSASVRRCACHCATNVRTIGTTRRTGADNEPRSPRQSTRSALAIVPGHGTRPSAS